MSSSILPNGSEDLPVMAGKVSQARPDTIKNEEEAYCWAVYTGRKLLWAKFLLGHGHFGSWLKENTKLTSQRANECMLLAKYDDRIVGAPAISIRAALTAIRELRRKDKGGA